MIESMSDDHVRLILERLERHTGEVGHPESGLQCFDRILLDHEKYHHGADVSAKSEDDK
jgi:hypothetical protein